jgi:hypothetical protein
MNRRPHLQMSREGKAAGAALVKGATTTVIFSASMDGVTGRAEIPQGNTLAGGDQNVQSGGHGQLQILIAVAGATGGVAIAAVRAGGGKSSSTTPSVPPTTLTVGAVTIGGPR